MTTARRDGDLVRDPRAAIATAVGMIGVVALLTVVVSIDRASPPVLQGFDDAWRARVLAWPDWTLRLGDIFETLGAGIVMVPFRVAVAAWLAFRRRRWDLAAWLLGWVVADVISAAMKPGVARERPTATEPGNPFTSFPSAHAKTAAQVAIGLVLVASSPWRARGRWYGAAIMWITLMAVSRTVVDHHWLSDVVAGSLLGAGAALLTAAAVQRIRDARGSDPVVPRDTQPPAATR